MNPTMIALMVRVPVPGKVKTRLIPRLGPAGACRLYQAMVEDILDQIAASGIPLSLLYTGGEVDQLPKSWQEKAAVCLAQQGQNLGARMQHGLITCHQCAESGILIGSDIPDMTSTVLVQAREALSRGPVVLAPAKDGGYCLLATTRGVSVQSVMTEMTWSTDQVLAETLRRLHAEGQEVALLPALRDLDTAEDLCAYWQSPNPEALHTNQVLASLTYPL